MVGIRSALTTLALLCVLMHSIAGAVTIQTLDYDDVVEKALGNAHDIRLSRLDIDISRAEQRRAYSLYYPTISARWNTEYIRDLTDGTAQINSIGNTVLVQNTTYQSSFLLMGSYNLFDFGGTQQKVSIAGKDVEAKRAVLRQFRRDIKLKVLSVYSDLLICYEELGTKKELLTLYKELALTKERLYTAGKISKIEMTDDAVKVVKIVDDIDTLMLRLKGLLEDLSSLTGEQYSADNTKVNAFRECEEDDLKHEFDPDNTPESKRYDLEMEKKKAELKVLERAFLPQFGLYSTYALYGSDPTALDISAQYVKPRNFFVGMAITLPLFEGFRSPAEIEKTKLELERLKVEKAKKMTELSTRHAKLSETRETYTSGIVHQKAMLTKVEEKLTMARRLSDQKEIEWAEYLNQKIDLVNQRFELTRTIISKTATIKDLRILSEAGD
jgi:outer membrane protein